jgi:hypothetical protein
LYIFVVLPTKFQIIPPRFGSSLLVKLNLEFVDYNGRFRFCRATVRAVPTSLVRTNDGRRERRRRSRLQRPLLGVQREADVG